MKRKAFSIFAILCVIVILTWIGCQSLWCPPVTGAYKNYDFPEGYLKFTSIISSSTSIMCSSYNSLVNDFEIVDDLSIGHYTLITDSSVLPTFYKDGIYPEIDLRDKCLILFGFETDLASYAYSKLFMAVNPETKKIMIRVQYELEDQCLGSMITRQCVGYEIVLPSHFEEYEIVPSARLMNPLE